VLGLEQHRGGDASVMDDDVAALYARRHPRHRIQPFIGEAFRTADPTLLRVLAVGINAYLAPDDLGKTQPESFAAWVRERRHHFYPRATNAALTLAESLASSSRLFEGRTVKGLDSLYLTNAVKTFLPHGTGRWATQVAREVFDEHHSTWLEELTLLERRGVFPDVIVVFGRPWWPWACRTFDPALSAPLDVQVLGHRWSDGPCRHHVNRYQLEVASQKRPLLLVGCVHPAARRRQGSPSWLLAQPHFRRLAGLEPLSRE